MNRLEKAIFRVARLIALLGLAGLLTLAFATVLDVLLRWIFNSPITGVRDLASLFVAIVISASMPACIAQRQHITIRFLGRLLGSRGEAGLEAFGNLVALIIFALMAWQLWIYAGQLDAQNEITMVLGWPLSPWWWGVSIIVAFCVPVQTIVLLNSIKLTISGRSLFHKEKTDDPEE